MYNLREDVNYQLLMREWEFTEDDIQRVLDTLQMNGLSLSSAQVADLMREARNGDLSADDLASMLDEAGQHQDRLRHRIRSLYHLHKA